MNVNANFSRQQMIRKSWRLELEDSNNLVGVERMKKFPVDASRSWQKVLDLTVSSQEKFYLEVKWNANVSPKGHVRAEEKWEAFNR